MAETLERLKVQLEHLSTEDKTELAHFLLGSLGRYVIVLFIFKPGNRALIISARDMDRKERRLYGR